ncbi:MAG: hypothetical protein R6U96_00405 [Promethearchaeia archaeon]
MPKIIKKEYDRYHKILGKTKIFKEIINCVEDLNETFDSIEAIISEDLESGRSFINKVFTKEPQETVSFNQGTIEELFELLKLARSSLKELEQNH